MPNGQTGLAEALAVPIKPTLPPRPSVSGLPRAREKAPVGPEQAEYPEDIVTGQPITQELNEAWMDLQNYVGSMWTTYGINIQKPDPSSPAQGEAHRRYIEKLNKVQTLGATAQRAKELQEHQISGKLFQSYGGTTPGLEKAQGIAMEEFDDLISDANQELHKFFSAGNLKQAEELKNRRSQYIDDRLDYLEKGGVDPEQIEFAKRNFKLRLETNYRNWEAVEKARLARTKEERAVREKEVPADIKRAINFLQAEKNPAGYTYDVTKKYKTREGTIIEYENVIKNIAPEEAVEFDPKKARINEIYERTPIDPDIIGEEGNVLIPEYHILSKNKDYYLFVFEGGKHKILPVGEAARNLLLFGGYFPTPAIEGKAMDYLATVEREEVPPTEKEKVPTKKKITTKFKATNAEGKTIISEDGKTWYDKETMEKIR